MRLSEQQFGALTELVDRGVRRAAADLALMVKNEVLLSVPKVAVLDRDDAIRTLERGSKNLIAVHQIFEGDIAGRALLIFPEARSLEFVRSAVGDELSLDEIIELEQEALAETGNLILNGCLATITSALGCGLTISLPEVLRSESDRLFALGAARTDAAMVFIYIYINFVVRHRDIDGCLIMMMDMPSLIATEKLLSDWISRTEEQ